MTVVSFVALGAEVIESGKGRRERAIREVMVGLERARWRTPVPMKPVEPVKMIFMVGMFGEVDS
jgi:hypothetical protein